MENILHKVYYIYSSFVFNGRCVQSILPFPEDDVGVEVVAIVLRRGTCLTMPAQKRFYFIDLRAQMINATHAGEFSIGLSELDANAKCISRQRERE